MEPAYPAGTRKPKVLNTASARTSSLSGRLDERLNRRREDLTTVLGCYRALAG